MRSRQGCEMKRLLIHIGYPKAASTTLQNALFMGLHELGLINFMGRAFESDYYGFADSKKQFKQWLKALGSNDDKSDNLNLIDAAISTDLFSRISDTALNVLSEGAFILNDRNGKTITMPDKIQRYFSGKVDQIEVLVVIRSQITLIMSNYVQRFKKIEEKRFSEYLDVHMNGPKKGLGDFKVYDFYSLAMKYAEVFGRDNLHFLLFEDMVHNKDAFSAALGTITGLDTNSINNCLGESKLNVTKLDSDYHICKKPVTNTLRYQVGRVIWKMGVDVGEMMKTKVPKITKSEEDAIFGFFWEGNLKLAQEFSLDAERMKEYRYF